MRKRGRREKDEGGENKYMKGKEENKERRKRKREVRRKERKRGRRKRKQRRKGGSDEVWRETPVLYK